MLVKTLKNIFLIFTLILFVSPLTSLVSIIFTETQKNFWMTALLPEYALNTIILMIGVGTVTLCLGVITAWFITFYSFPGRKIFEILLFLPLSIPGYIVAFVYTNIFDFAGPLQSFLREIFHWQKGDYWFPNVKSLTGGIIIIGCSLYPYVYMIARSSLLSISSAVAVATTLGRSRFNILSSVAIPSIRPAIVAGLSLVLMEVIADFGTSQFLSIDTFTTSIYRYWFLLHDKYSAAILACIELGFVLILIIIEKLSRKKGVSYSTIKMNTEYYSIWKVDNKVTIIIIYAICLLPVIIGFLLPIIPLIWWTVERLGKIFYDFRFYRSIFNSIMVSSITGVVTIIISIILAYIMRVRKSSITSCIVRFVTLGYAVPNTVIAVSILIFLGKVMQLINIYIPDFILIGTIFALLYSYTFRCLAVSLGPIESRLGKVPIEIDWSSATIGHNPFYTCFHVHIPIIKKSILIGFLLAFVDTIKELSATLIVRPFNFETIATRTYELVNDERYMDAAPFALLIVIISLISVVILSHTFKCYCQREQI